MLLSNESADDKWLMFDLLKSLHVLVFFYFLQIEMFQKFEFLLSTISYGIKHVFGIICKYQREHWNHLRDINESKYTGMLTSGFQKEKCTSPHQEFLHGMGHLN